MQPLLPLFPLTTALVPGLVLPLHIFEPRYRELVAQLLDEPDEDAREFGIIAVREGRDPHRDGMAALYPIGTTALLRSAERLADGRYDIVTTGGRRFEILELDVSAPLAFARVEFLDDITSDEDEVLAERTLELFLEYRELLSGQVDATTSELGLPDDPTVISYLVTAATVLDVPERQELLAARTTKSRLELARRLLTREIALVSTLGSLPAIEPFGVSPSAN